MEIKRVNEEELQNELRELGLEMYETTEETMMEEMGASKGIVFCCSSVGFN